MGSLKKFMSTSMLIESFSIFIYAFRFGYIRKNLKDNDTQIPFSTDSFKMFLFKLWFHID
jgi:hypothetical protein